MCGITGLVNFKKNFIDYKSFRESTNSIEHRGPDLTNFWYQENTFLGHTYLKVRDAETNKTQPMFDQSNRYIIIYNGEIYNNSEINKTLARKGINLKSKTDTETIINYFKINQSECLNALNGMYVFAIWDTQEKELTLARDKIGIKTFYYYFDENYFYFSSEIKSFKKINFKFQFNTKNLDHLLMKGFSPPKSSIFKGIKQIQPGEILKLKGKNLKSYYINYEKNNYNFTNLNNAIDYFEELFPKVIENQLQSDQDVALLKSGGIDSNLIYNYINNPKLNIYTAKFKNSTFDESNLSSLNILSKNNFSIINIDENMNDEIFTKSINSCDYQVIDPAIFPTYKLFDEIKNKNTKVVITGDGADELFYGYETYMATNMSKYFNFLPSAIFKKLYLFFYNFNSSEKRLALTDIFLRYFYSLYINKNFPHAHYRDHFMEYHKNLLYNGSLKEYSQNFYTEYDNFFINKKKLLESSLKADQDYLLPSQLLRKIDYCSMAHGIEARVPFLDDRIIKFSRSIENLNVPNIIDQNKKILRSILKTKKNSKLLAKQKKRGFNVPLNYYFKTSLKKYVKKILIDETEIFDPYFKINNIKKIYYEHQENKKNHEFIIFQLLNFACCRKSFNIR